jgi:hypothetical protein
MSKKVLICWGGWEGHEPKPCSELVADVLSKEGFDVELSNSLDVYLDMNKIMALDLIINNWTMSTITKPQTAGLIAAVKSGVGLAGWHGGLGDAFRSDTSYQFMVGGQFVYHPPGRTEFEVNIVNHDDPITQGIDDFKMGSEPYFMHVDPSNDVLATMTVHNKEHSWIDGCVMPVVWKRKFYQGKVFYSSLGHVAKEFIDTPQVLEIQTRGMLWACR